MKVRARELAIAQNWNENDIEFQGDGSKATFITPQMTVLTFRC
jgi:hypothetical protein